MSYFKTFEFEFDEPIVKQVNDVRAYQHDADERLENGYAQMLRKDQEREDSDYHYEKNN